MRSGAAAEQKSRPLTNIEKIKLIEETIEREVRPSLRKDGGDLDLVDVVDNRVIVAPRGMCATCPASPVTLKDLVEAKLHEFVSDALIVEEVKA